LYELTGGRAGTAPAQKTTSPMPARTSSPWRPSGTVTKSDTREVTNQQQQPREQQIADRIEAIRRDPALYTDTPRQKELMSEMHKLLASAMTRDELQRVIEEPVATQRSRFGIDHGQAVPSYVADQWDSQSEQRYLTHFVALGIEPQQVRSIYEWYGQKFVGAMGDHANLDVPAVIEEFKSVAKRNGISDKLADALVAAELERLGLGQ
jgi:hypothetical protein